MIKNERLSEFALRLQYLVMVLLYGLVMCFLFVPSVPLLYLKSIINVIYIACKRKRQDYRYQNVR